MVNWRDEGHLEIREQIEMGMYVSGRRELGRM
jgi:hypothetical protein